MNATAFLEALEPLLPESFGGRFCLAFSGGMDSTVLMHLFADLRSLRPAWRIRAMHVDHQLQPTSRDWALRCAAVATQLDIAFHSTAVVVDQKDEQGLEAAARRSRYAAFAQALEPGEALVTAHHADDQAETVLLALMRGSGVQGLAAMPGCKRWARGWHIRPLLGFSRAAIAEWARARHVEAIDDPTNRLLRHDRNFLRHEVLPALERRWPAAAANIGRTARHLGEALELLEEHAASDWVLCQLGDCLQVTKVIELSPARRRNLIRFWLRQQGIAAPSTRKLAGLDRDLACSAPDRVPRVSWRGGEVYWHRGLLYARAASKALLSTDQPGELRWVWRQPLRLPDALGSLELVPTEGPGLAAARLPDQLTVRFRSGGEKIRLPGRAHRHELKKLLQERGVLPWWRDRLPLIYIDRALIAVGDLLYADDVAARAGEAAVQIAWIDAPPWRAMELSRD